MGINEEQTAAIAALSKRVEELAGMLATLTERLAKLESAPAPTSGGNADKRLHELERRAGL